MSDDTRFAGLFPIEPEAEKEKFEDTFRVTVSDGERWVDISNGFDMWVSPEGFGTHNQSWRKEEARSRFYHGSYLLHATKDNVVEPVTIFISGQSQNDVTEIILMLKELFSQFSYQVRVQYGNHRTTWYCQMADHSVDRSHVLLHNTMAKMTFQVPRLPETTEEIIL